MKPLDRNQTTILIIIGKRHIRADSIDPLHSSRCPLFAIPQPSSLHNISYLFFGLVNPFKLYGVTYQPVVQQALSIMSFSIDEVVLLAIVHHLHLFYSQMLEGRKKKISNLILILEFPNPSPTRTQMKALDQLLDYTTSTYTINFRNGHLNAGCFSVPLTSCIFSRLFYSPIVEYLAL